MQFSDNFPNAFFNMNNMIPYTVQISIQHAYFHLQAPFKITAK